jgi:hypothetical protein
MENDDQNEGTIPQNPIEATDHIEADFAPSVSLTNGYLSSEQKVLFADVAKWALVSSIIFIVLALIYLLDIMKNFAIPTFICAFIAFHANKFSTNLRGYVIVNDADFFDQATYHLKVLLMTSAILITIYFALSIRTFWYSIYYSELLTF